MKVGNKKFIGFMIGNLLLIAILALFATGSSTTAIASNNDIPFQEYPVHFLTGPNQGDAAEIALTYVDANKADFALTKEDLDGYAIIDQFVSEHNGTTHIYLGQQFNGLEIFNKQMNINVAADGSIINVNNGFISNIQGAAHRSTVSLTAVEAVSHAATHLGLTLKETPTILEKAEGVNQATQLSPAGISLQDSIPARLMYFPLEDGTLQLSWFLEIDTPGGMDYAYLFINAKTGELVHRGSYTINESWGAADHNLAANETAQDETGQDASESDGNSLMMVGSYNVFPLPIESPSHGGRSIIANPDNPTASPYGWHDTNGAAGAEYTTTRGNNAHAYEDGNNPGFSPNGGASLNFNFPLNLSQAPDNYEAAAITNLFYWNNLMHDITYVYGFDEASGNFQENNYGNGASGSDSVNAEAQDGSGTNNANFSTPPDGSNPRMQMYLWTAPNPDRDGDLDNGIIAHEYGHGISNRLTGGRTTTSCLNNSEQMGEGWSDYFSLLTSMNGANGGPTDRGIGTYALNQPTTGAGIRQYRYSRSIVTNPHTYDDIKTVAVPHGVGSVWAEMLWEMTWNLIDQHGFDADIYNGTGGNNISMQLVIDGMKLQPCSPGFVTGRDAILLADQNNYGGANQCLIWEAFAKRGLGVNANQGSSGSRSDGTENFDLPAACSGVTPTPPPTNTPPPGNTVFIDDFESNQGWTTNPSGNDTATTGQWERGNPEQTASGSNVMQLGNTVSGLNALVTGRLAGTSVGTHDIDNGETSVRSPNISLPSASTINLSFSYYMSHLNNGTSDDYLRVKVVGSSTNTVLEELGAANTDVASWQTFNTSLNSFAGQTIYLLIEAADAAGGSLIEAAIDDVLITADGSVTPTNTPVPPTPTNTPVPPTPTNTPPPPSCTTYTSSNVPIGLPNGTASISSNLSVSGGGTIADIDVNVDMAHAWVGDLTFTLAKGGTSVTVIDRPGVPASTWGCSGDNISATLSDEAGTAVEGVCAGGSPTINGTFSPNNALSAFDGQSSNGTWTLTVADAYTSADAGTLNGWSIEVCTQ